MKLAALVAVCAVVVLGACTGPPPAATTTTTQGGADTPEAALVRLIEAVDAGEYAETELVTFDNQLILLVSLEVSNAAETAGMLREGVPDSVRENFWGSFFTSFAAFAEEELSGLVIESGEEFSVEGKGFATVAVSLPESGGDGDWIVRQDEQGRWRLDLFATFGPAFASPFRDWLAGLEEGTDADMAVAALADQRASLLAALQRQPFGPISPAAMSQVDALLLEVGR